MNVHGLNGLMIAMAARAVLVGARAAGFLGTSAFPGPWAPTQAKIALVVLVTWVVTPILPAGGPATVSLAIVPVVVSEVALGALLGFVFRVAMVSAETLGASVAQAMGLSFAAAMDPTTGGDAKDPMSRLVSLGATLLALGAGAHRVAIGYVLASFQALPPSSTWDTTAATPALIGQLSLAVDVGIRLALPVVVVTLAIQLVLAFVSRAAPQLQIFNVGIAITVAAGVALFVTGWDETASGLTTHFSDLGRAYDTALSRVK